MKQLVAQLEQAAAPATWQLAWLRLRLRLGAGQRSQHLFRRPPRRSLRHHSPSSPLLTPDKDQEWSGGKSQASEDKLAPKREIGVSADHYVLASRRSRPCEAACWRPPPCLPPASSICIIQCSSSYFASSRARSARIAGDGHPIDRLRASSAPARAVATVPAPPSRRGYGTHYYVSLGGYAQKSIRYPGNEVHRFRRFLRILEWGVPGHCISDGYAYTAGHIRFSAPHAILPGGFRVVVASRSL
eukprot:COSAG02_NODE_2918_length_7752_cov_4.486215_5_plen_244_part_00